MSKRTVFALMTLCAPSLWAAEFPATLQWSHRVELSTPVSGTVKVVNADVGDKVGKGQALLALDNTLPSATVDQVRAETVHLRAKAEEDRRELDRVTELHDRTVASTAELDQARLADIKSNSLLVEAQARLVQSQKLLDDTVLRAPFDGVVVGRQVEPGQIVAAQLQPKMLFVVAKSGEMIARIALAMADADRLKVGQAATVSVNNARYLGKVKSVGLEPVATKDGSAYVADVLFTTADTLRAGSVATVSVP